MPAITNKQQLLTFAQATKRVSAGGLRPAEPRPLLEELVYAICREGATPADADAAYARLLKTFIDWNEVRVSTVQEVGEILRPLSAPGTRAHHRTPPGGIRGQLHLRPRRDRQEGPQGHGPQTALYKEGVNDYAVAWVVQRTLGGHAIPLDEPTLRVLSRPGSWRWTPRASRRHAAQSSVIPKTRGPEFTDLMSVHAKELCIEKDPRCPQCPLKTECPVGIENTARKTEPKPKKSR